MKRALEEIQKRNAKVVIPIRRELFQVDIVYAMIIITMMDHMNYVVHVILIGTFIFIKFNKSLQCN